MQPSNRTEIKAWAMYDWANSAFVTTVTATFLGPYLALLIEEMDGAISLLGYPIEAEAFYPFCVAVSVILQVILLPILATLADYSPVKKRLLLTFAYTGAGATILLFFIRGNLALLGGGLFIIANLAYGASIAFYNAFLPDIAPPDERDTVSAQGFAYGYVGGGLLLLLNLAAFWLIDDSRLAIRLNLASAGIWWLIFTRLYPHRHLRQRPVEAQQINFLNYGFKEFVNSLREMKNHYPMTLRFLIGYLIFNDGIQTVITVATIFALSELQLGLSLLAPVMLVAQFAAGGGSLLFNRLTGRIGAKTTLMLTLVIWAGLLLYAYFLLYTAFQFWILAVCMGLVLGSSQALSRSIFSQIVPKHRESAYFGLYEISDRGTSWSGPFLFAATVQLTGSSRVAMLPIITFFAVGLAIVYWTDIPQAIRAAGNKLPAVI